MLPVSFPSLQGNQFQNCFIENFLSDNKMSFIVTSISNEYPRLEEL